MSNLRTIANSRLVDGEKLDNLPNNSLGTFLQDAPVDGKQYARKNNTWDEVTLTGNIHWSDIINKPLTFTPSAHTHTKSDITDFPTIPTKTSDLTNDSGFITSAGSGTGDMLASNNLSDVADATTARTNLDVYSTSQVDTALSGKANTNHTHTASQITDFQATVTANTEVSANTIARHTHSNKTILDNTTASYTTTEQTKLSGIATGATANDTDANLKNRSNHTGTQAISTVTGLQTALDAFDSGRYNLSTSGTGKTIDWNNGRRQYMTMTGNCTITFSNPVAGRTYVLELTQDATGSRIITRPSTVKTPGGAGAVLSTTANAKDVVTLYYDGTNYLTHIAKAYA